MRAAILHCAWTAVSIKTNGRGRRHIENNACPGIKTMGNPTIQNMLILFYPKFACITTLS